MFLIDRLALSTGFRAKSIEKGLPLLLVCIIVFSLTLSGFFSPTFFVVLLAAVVFSMCFGAAWGLTGFGVLMGIFSEVALSHEGLFSSISFFLLPLTLTNTLTGFRRKFMEVCFIGLLLGGSIVVMGDGRIVFVSIIVAALLERFLFHLLNVRKLLGLFYSILGFIYLIVFVMSENLDLNNLFFLLVVIGGLIILSKRGKLCSSERRGDRYYYCLVVVASLGFLFSWIATDLKIDLNSTFGALSVTTLLIASLYFFTHAFNKRFSGFGRISAFAIWGIAICAFSWGVFFE